MSTGKPLVVVVGGFLGAGKTTLILSAASILRGRGARVAVITNDQGENLVDTHVVRTADLDAVEIGGGCLCCRFSDFIEGCERVQAYGPDVIFAEPVGSCTDIAATVLRPLQSLYADQFRVAPFTVVIDPHRVGRIIGNGADPNVRFLFEHQVREADLLCYTKSDLYEHFPPIGRDQPLRVSGAAGTGVREWLDLVLGSEGKAGARTLAIDYDRYAAAEAALGWLNARCDFDLDVPVSPARLVGPLLDRIDEQLSALGIAIVHFKLFDRTSTAYLRSGIVENREEPAVEGDLLAPAERHHELVINLRALGPPERLRTVVEEALLSVHGRTQIDINAFAPAYPTPQHRMMQPNL